MECHNDSAISEIEFQEQAIDPQNSTWKSSLKEKISNETAKFFGVISPRVDEGDVCTADQEDLIWQFRRFRYLIKQSAAKEQAVADVLQANIGSLESLAECVDSGNVSQDPSRLLDFPSSTLFRSGAAGSLPLLASSNHHVPRYPSHFQTREYCSSSNMRQKRSNVLDGSQNEVQEYHTAIYTQGNSHENMSGNEEFRAYLPQLCSLSSIRQLGSNFVMHLKRDYDSLDYRAFFSYWVTTVQIIIMIFMLFHYGIGTDFSNGFGVVERSGDVLASSLSLRRIVVWEQNNVWIGPNFADLVRAGAKYTPCMRYDQNIQEQITRDKRDEADLTGCCVSSHGCFQTSECPKQFATLIKWSNKTVDEMTKPTRVVCGQDPRYCSNPQSVHPFEWNATDVSQWPVCEVKKSTALIPKQAEHMHCEITGRPCCIQMQGQCRITTKDYCDFVRGSYHQNATLCSQVSCLKNVCGMTPFVNDNPDQIYRLFTPLFIHAGIIRCAISIVFQMTIMRQFETMVGWLRLSIIYIVSGIGGYLASAIFVPYMPEVGPAGSHGGILGALIVNVIYNWNFLQNPKRVLFFHLSIAAGLFITGFLPYIDNWAQLFGFIFGCILATALIPYFNFKSRTRRLRLTIVVFSLGLTLLIFLILFSTFYAQTTSRFHTWSSLLNCPFSGKVCDHQGLILKNWLPI